MKYKGYESMPLILSVPQIGEILGIGRNTAYGLVSSGVLPALRIGKQYRIPRECLIRYIESAKSLA